MVGPSSFEKFCDRLIGLITTPVALFIVPIVMLLGKLLPSSPADPDLFARLGMGRIVEKLGAVPLEDPFAFTPKLPAWIDHEWLSGVVFYQIGSHLGDAGLILLKLLISVWTCVLLIRASLIYSPRATGSVLWITICILDASFLWGSTIRCQVFTYFFLALIYLGYAEYQIRNRARYLALVPLISLAWVNLHGGYALGMMTLALLTATAVFEGKKWRLPLVVTLLSCAALWATPYGFEQFAGYLIDALTMPRGFVEEWGPLWRNKSSFILSAALVSVISTGCILIFKRGGRDLTAIALLLFSAYCGFRHIRLSGFFTITAAVFGAQYFGAFIEGLRSRWHLRMRAIERVLALVSSVILVGIGTNTGLASLRRETWRLNHDSYPTQAFQWLRASGITGQHRLLVDFNNGSFALWRLYPLFQISLDGRYEEVYPDQTVLDVSEALAPKTPQAKAAIERLAPTHILFQNPQAWSEIQNSLGSEWREIYRDDSYTLYSRIPNHPTPSNIPGKMETIWDPMF